MSRRDGGSGEEARELPKRWSANRKLEVVLRLLKGESLDALSRETGRPASELSAWRDEFLEGGREAMKSRADDPVVQGLRQERRELLSKLGEKVMEVELLERKIEKLESGLPLAQRRSKR